MKKHPEIQKFLAICDRQKQVMTKLIQKMRRSQTEEEASEIRVDLERELEYNLFMLKEFDKLLERLQDDNHSG